MDNKRYDLDNVLITGASGSVGKIICATLKRHNIKFKKLSNFKKHKNFLLEHTNSVLKLSKKIRPSLIIHSAIDSKIKPTLKKNSSMMKNLIRYFDNIPIIYISSVSVYSGVNQKNLSETLIKYKLDTKYSLIKKKCEDILLLRKFKKDLCLRIPGLFFNKRTDGLLYNLLKKYKNENHEIKFFDLNKQWQFIHEKHFQFYFLKVLKMKKNNFNIINIGYDDSVSITKVIDILNKKLNYKEKILIKKKSLKSRLNLNRLKKISNIIFKLNDGIELLIKNFK